MQRFYERIINFRWSDKIALSQPVFPFCFYSKPIHSELLPSFKLLTPSHTTSYEAGVLVCGPNNSTINSDQSLTRLSIVPSSRKLLKRQAKGCLCPRYTLHTIINYSAWHTKRGGINLLRNGEATNHYITTSLYTYSTWDLLEPANPTLLNLTDRTRCPASNVLWP